MSKGKPHQSEGGKARASALSPERRKEIAAAGAAARWNLPKATHRGVLEIGDSSIPCAVLEDGRRVLTETGIANAILGGRSGASRRTRDSIAEDGAPLPVFLSFKRFKPLISKELAEGPLKVTKYLDGSRVVNGYDATVLPAACEIWLSARDQGILLPSQLDKAQSAEIMMRGLAHIGIVALVDEATGYEQVRDKMALQAILDKFLKKEFAAWAKRFPDEFYKEMFRLRGWEFDPLSVARPGVVGKYTTDLVYDRLAPGIVNELEANNPKDSKGNRRYRHHQLLTDDVGHPALAQHLHAVIGFMRASSDWDQFKTMMDRAFPKKGDTLTLDM